MRSGGDTYWYSKVRGGSGSLPFVCSQPPCNNVLYTLRFVLHRIESQLPSHSDVAGYILIEVASYVVIAFDGFLEPGGSLGSSIRVESYLYHSYQSRT